MKILQLCCFSNYWPSNYEVVSIDLKLGSDIFDISLDFAKGFDAIVSAPVCTQFSKANNRRWLLYPQKDILLVQQCLYLSINSGLPWFLENPPGRITSLIPSLIAYRKFTYQCLNASKEYVIFSNLPILTSYSPRYGKASLVRGKLKREEWQPDLVDFFNKQLLLSLSKSLNPRTSVRN